MLVFQKIPLGIILSVIVLVISEEEPEEKDPWDKSTDKYRHHTGTSDDEPVKIDVTEVSESEVHSSKSKVCRDCNSNIVVQETPHIANNTKSAKASNIGTNKKEIDDETKDQIKDAIDEKDPADLDTKELRGGGGGGAGRGGGGKRHRGHKKQQLEKKQLNHKIDFYPGSLWEYPYPYYHPQYGCGGKEEPCTGEGKPTEAKQDKKEKAKKKKAKVEGKVLPKIKGFGWAWKGPQISEIGTSWGTPCWFNKEKKQFSCRQLIPSHYYGPPSAGWGGFQPGHTGSGWGVPYWYKKCATPHKSCRQIIPSHYYGPPSAGWGGFKPGQTGGGWGTPYWYKKCATPRKNCRQIIPSHYYGPPSAGWGGFQPGQTGGGWGTPYWYKKCATPQVSCRNKIPSSSIHGLPRNSSWFVYRPSKTSSWRSSTSSDKSHSGGDVRKEEVPTSLAYKLSSEQAKDALMTPGRLNSKYSIAALHEWISYLEYERGKDRELERYKIEMREKENERRYNLDILRYTQQRQGNRLLKSVDSPHTETSQISYYINPSSKDLRIDNPAVEYLLNSNMGRVYHGTRKQ